MDSNRNGTSFGYGEDIPTNSIKRHIAEANLFLRRCVLTCRRLTWKQGLTEATATVTSAADNALAESTDTDDPPTHAPAV